MRRREFIRLISGAAVSWPVVAGANDAMLPLVGFLGASSKASTQQYYASFLRGMLEIGYAEGRNYAAEQRYADGDLSLLPQLAQGLVQLRPKLIVADSTPGALAAKRVTESIPIVGLNMTDPVGLGLIASEAQPGTNVTGSLIRVEGLAAKLLDIAHELKPYTHKIGLLANANNPSNVVQRREIEAAVTRLDLGLSIVEVRTVKELGPAFQTFVREGVDIVIVFTGAVLINARREVAKLALASRLPTICGREDFVESGALISYGINQRETYHRAAYYVDKILKGEKPAILPVEFSTTLKLVVNGGTAKAIGLNIPSTMLARADEVIQ